MHSRRNHLTRWAWGASLMGLIAAEVRAQTPEAPASPPGAASCNCKRRGPIHRMLRHAGSTLRDDFIGYPDAFIEPPVGYYINEQLAVQVAKADTHRFTLYRSDFLPGTDKFSPGGASRFNLMFTRLHGWLGPIVVEWTPDQPALAEARRQAVLATLEKAGRPMVAERVVIGPSPYPGAIGIEAMNNFSNTIFRGQAAPQTFTLPPNESASMGVR